MADRDVLGDAREQVEDRRLPDGGGLAALLGSRREAEAREIAHEVPLRLLGDGEQLQALGIGVARPGPGQLAALAES